MIGADFSFGICKTVLRIIFMYTSSTERKKGMTPYLYFYEQEAELKQAEEKRLIPETFADKDFTKPITRKEFAAVAVKMYEAISKTTVEPVANNPFTDTNDEYVLKAYNMEPSNPKLQRAMGDFYYSFQEYSLNLLNHVLRF